MRELRRGRVRRRSCDLCGWALRIARARMVVAHANRAPTRTRKGVWPVGLRRRSRPPVAPRLRGGSPGPAARMVWWAQDEDFATLYALYLLAVAASAFGVAASILIRRDLKGAPMTRRRRHSAPTSRRSWPISSSNSSRTSASSWDSRHGAHLCGNQNFTARSC